MFFLEKTFFLVSFLDKNNIFHHFVHLYIDKCEFLCYYYFIINGTYAERKDFMKKESFKKIAAPSFYILVGAIGLLLMLLNYAEVNYGVILPNLSSTGLTDGSGAIGYTAFEAIRFGDGSIKAVLELCFLPYAKEVAAPLLLSVLSVIFIIFAALCAMLFVVGIFALLTAIIGSDPFKINLLNIAAILARVQVIILVLCDLMFVFSAFLNLYSISGSSFVGLKPAVGFYVLTAVFAAAFILHELYIKKSDESEANK